jgi:prepilin-type N-terminal cleavage/methylation domain-containing protein
MKKKGFTLIEVMVAVMLISIVIAALLKLQADNAFIFTKIKQDIRANGFISLINNSKYGYENDSLSLDRLVENFDIDDDLRQELKNIRAKTIYVELEKISLADEDEEDMNDEEKAAPVMLEIGKTVLKLSNSSTSIIRIKIR